MYKMPRTDTISIQIASKHNMLGSIFAIIRKL